MSELRKDQILLERIKQHLPRLEKVLEDVSSWYIYEDAVYRFYHHSFKTYYVQEATKQIVEVLQSLMPDAPLNEWFLTLVREGTGKEFQLEHNKRWLQEVRPMLEAFFHAKYFLEMVVKFGRKLDAAPNVLDVGWAAVLCLYNMR
jgi:hypothetical protein